MKNIIITGGAGFIGSHLVRRFVTRYPHYKIINLDSLTYAGNLNNLLDIENQPNYIFEHVDITDEIELRKIFTKYRPDGIIHLAAESHVDKSFYNTKLFINTNIIGTINLLNLCKEFWNLKTKFRINNKNFNKKKIFYHISTDEVYGSLDSKGFFTEKSCYNPKSPYSASKAASDHFVRAYYNSYGLPFLMSHSSNNFGPNHYPEKLIPLSIFNILHNTKIPIYGNGKYIRDWLFVIDHVIAIDKIFHQSKIGETYNIGGFNEWKNIDLIHKIIEYIDKKLGNPIGKSKSLISFVEDRPGHDKRYAINSYKLNKEIGWKPSLNFDSALAITIDWYLDNRTWLDNIILNNKDHY